MNQFLGSVKKVYPEGRQPVDIPLVQVTDLESATVPEPEYILDPLIPSDVVTLLGGHGGTGKTFLALQMAVCVATGNDFMGLSVRTCPVLFFSAEDNSSIVRWRLKTICGRMGINPKELKNLTVMDATDIDPALFREVRTDGIKHGMTTGVYESLSIKATDVSAQLVIIDNASDTYDADEIDRARVRAFIRSLASIARKIGGGVMLIAHIDKATAKTGGKEGYSGSTAWHNSVRSRLFLSANDDKLTLEHQKANLGQKAEPIHMAWSNKIIVPANEAELDTDTAIIESQNSRAILRLIAEFYQRGEYIPTAPTAPGNAWRLLSGDKDFPRMDRNKFQPLIREIERAGHLEREKYQNAYRKERERWSVSKIGFEMLEKFGDAPSAPT